MESIASAALQQDLAYQALKGAIQNDRNAAQLAEQATKEAKAGAPSSSGAVTATRGNRVNIVA